MFPVSYINDDVKKILGTCDEDTKFRRLNEAVELLANKGDWDPLLGRVDICVQDRFLSLPREVETVISVNIGGRPAIGQDKLFNFHLNGPGDDGFNRTCRYTWKDGFDCPTFKDLQYPSKLVSRVFNAEDSGKELWVYGQDDLGNDIRTKEGDTWYDGYRVPTIFGYQVPDADAPLFRRVTRVRKADNFVSNVSLTSFDASLTTGTLIGMYQYDETEPLYRRIELSVGCKWARIAYRKNLFRLKSLNDLIPLHSSLAVLLALRAIKAYNSGDLGEGQGFEATATRFLAEEQETRTPPTTFPIQVDPRNLLQDKSDDVD